MQIPVTIVPSIEKRDYVINELIETEKNYVDVLNTLQKSFMRPLVNIITEDDYAVIFFGIKVGNLVTVLTLGALKRSA